MTSEQRERLLGMVVQGTSPSTACEVLGVRAAELLDELVHDPPFLLDLYVALQGRRLGEQAIEHLND